MVERNERKGMTEKQYEGKESRRERGSVFWGMGDVAAGFITGLWGLTPC